MQFLLQPIFFRKITNLLLTSLRNPPRVSVCVYTFIYLLTRGGLVKVYNAPVTASSLAVTENNKHTQRIEGISI